MAKKILVVDDEPDILKIVVFRLKKLGYEVTTASNGQEALDFIQKIKPDLVVLDLIMPVVDGYEVCKQVKADEKLRHIPVILLTASFTGELADKAEKLGADDYLMKPFDPEELLTKVKKFIT